MELDPELSWNTELGMRARIARHASLDATFFRLDYSNQIIPASLAGRRGRGVDQCRPHLESGNGDHWPL